MPQDLELAELTAIQKLLKFYDNESLSDFFPTALHDESAKLSEFFSAPQDEDEKAKKARTAKRLANRADLEKRENEVKALIEEKHRQELEENTRLSRLLETAEDKGDHPKRWVTILFKAYEVVEKSLELAAKPLLHAVVHIIAPIKLAWEGVVGVFELARAIQNKNTGQRKTKIVTNILMLGAAVAGVLVATNPIGLAVCLLGAMTLGLYRESYSTHQTSKARHQEELRVTEREKLLVRKSAEIAKLEIQLSQTEGDRDIRNIQHEIEKHKLERNIIEIQLTRHREILEKLEDTDFITKRKMVFRVISAIGSGFLVAGLFFPPLLIPGAAILLASGMTAAIDRAMNHKITKGIGRTLRGVTRTFSKGWNKFKKFAGFNRQPVVVPTAQAVNRPSISPHESEARVYSALTNHPIDALHHTVEHLHQVQQEKPHEDAVKADKKIALMSIADHKHRDDEDEGEGEKESEGIRLHK